MTLTTDRRAQLLSTVALFDGIGPDDLAMVAGRTIEVDFPAGRPIVRQGEVGTGFFLLATGSARVIRDGQPIAELGPGDFFGELSLLDGSPRGHTVVAAEDSELLVVAQERFDALLAADPGLRRTVHETAAERRAASKKAAAPTS